MPGSPRLVIFGLLQPMVLAFAWAMGRGACAVLRSRVRPPVAVMTIASVLAISLGLVAVGWLVPGLELWSPVSLAAAFAADVAVLSVVSAVALSRASARRPPTIEEQARLGESDVLEFKSSARVNMVTGQKDDRMETVVVKTIAAFVNTRGGTLLVGVDDEGTLIGLDADLAILRQPDADRFELWLRDTLHERLGANAAALPAVDFTTNEHGSLVCRVQCPPSPAPVFVRSGKGGAATTELWVRVGNSTRSLRLDDAVEYIGRRWPAPVATSARANLRELAHRLRGPA